MECLEFATDSLPIWFHLHRILLEFFTRTGLSYLASALGKPLYMDRVTAARKRLAFAKVCIEVSAASDFPSSINAVLENGRSFSIGVSVPWMPSKCASCKTFGHSDDACPKSAAAVKGKNVQWLVKTKQQDGTMIPPKDAQVDGLHSKMDAVGESSGSQMAPPPTACSGSNELGNDLSAAPKDAQGALQLVVSESDIVVESPLAAIAPTPLAVVSPNELGTSDSKGKNVISPVLDDNQFQPVTYKGSSAGSKSSHSAAKSHSSKVQFSGSKNAFTALAEASDTDITAWQQMIDNAKVTQKVRAASKGVPIAVQAIKSTKARNLAKGVLGTNPPPLNK